MTGVSDQSLVSEPTTRSLMCEHHGEYQSTAQVVLGREFRSGCPACTQRRKEDRRQAGLDWESRQEQERREARARVSAQRSGIPKRFGACGTDTYVATQPGQAYALAVTRAYAENFAEALADCRCLVFTGTTGTGKTHLAIAIANRALRQGYTAVYSPLLDIVDTVKDTWRKESSQSSRQALQPYLECDLLVIDEVGVQFDTDAERVIMSRLIDRRYEAMRPIILVSNLSLDAPAGEPSVRSVLGARIVDRLRENGGKVVRFDWPSHRRGA